MEFKSICIWLNLHICRLILNIYSRRQWKLRISILVKNILSWNQIWPLKRGTSVNNQYPFSLLPTSHPSEDARMARRQQNRAVQDLVVGRKILDQASKSVTSCNVDSPETKWCDSFSQSKGSQLYLAHMCSFLGSTQRLNLNVVRFYCLFT